MEMSSTDVHIEAQIPIMPVSCVYLIKPKWNYDVALEINSTLLRTAKEMYGHEAPTKSQFRSTHKTQV